MLLRRISSRGGFWQGVTGGVEEGENLEEAARRELFEEAGLLPIALERIDYSYSFPVEDKWRHIYEYGDDVEEIVAYVFLAYMDDKEPTIDTREHERWKWCQFAEALKLLTWSGDIEALKRCDKALATHD
ncbi:MAG: NUDIX pyrophosphatase [Thermoplasmata archaeon]